MSGVERGAAGVGTVGHVGRRADGRGGGPAAPAVVGGRRGRLGVSVRGGGAARLGEHGDAEAEREGEYQETGETSSLTFRSGVHVPPPSGVAALRRAAGGGTAGFFCRPAA